MAFVDWLNRAGTVQRYAGPGATGPVYDPPVALRYRAEPDVQLVRDGQGQEVVSSTRLFAAPDAPVTPESRVTLDDGRVTTVISVSRVDAAHAAHHLEIRLR